MTFSELIRSEEEVLKRLLIVSQRQVALVQEGDATVLIQHLGRREQLWKEFELLEKQLEPYKGIPPEQRRWKNTEERQTTEATLDRCKAYMEQILANDQVSLTTMAAAKDEREGKLDQVRRGQNAAIEYGRQSRQPPPEAGNNK